FDDDDDNDDDDLNREDLKDLMETLSLSQRTKNKRKRTFDDDDEDDDDDDYQINDKQSQSVHSKYRTGGGGIHRTLNPSSKQQQRPGYIYIAKRGSGGDRKLANK
ncbi:unnamed protein product, partial [Rotaria sp. Silwood1]